MTNTDVPLSSELVSSLSVAPADRPPAAADGVTALAKQDFDKAKVLLDAWKFRQAHCWTSLQRYSIAAVAVSIVPYVKPDLVTQLGPAIFVFPGLGLIIGLATVWLFGAEYVRCYPVHNAFLQHVDEADLGKPHQVGWKKVFDHSIGWNTVKALLLGFLILGIGNFFLVRNLAAYLAAHAKP